MKGNAKNVKILILSHPLEDLGVTYMLSLWLVGKRVVDFLVLIELLSLAITVETLSRLVRMVLVGVRTMSDIIRGNCHCAPQNPQKAA